MNIKIKKFGMPLLKLFIAVVLTYWLLRSDKLDFHILLESFKHPVIWIIGFVLVCFQIIAGGLRWRAILKMFDIQTSSSQIIPIQWIGHFFSTVLPGAVTGDLIKISFLNIHKEKGTNKLLLFSILADRLCALAGLILLVTIVGVFNLKELSLLNPQVGQFMLLLIWGVGAAIVVLMIGFIFKDKIQNLIPNAAVEKLASFHKKIFHKWTPSMKGFVVIVFASVLAQVLGVLSFIVITQPFLEKAVPLKFMLTLVPLGQLAVVLPISPAGFGVGHVAYSKIFEFLGHTNGASLFNIYWFLISLVNLLGMIPFLKRR